MVCEMKQLILHDDNYYTPTHGLILHMMQFRKYFREEKVLFILFLSLSLSLCRVSTGVVGNFFH